MSHSEPHCPDLLLLAPGYLLKWVLLFQWHINLIFVHIKMEGDPALLRRDLKGNRYRGKRKGPRKESWGTPLVSRGTEGVSFSHMDTSPWYVGLRPEHHPKDLHSSDGSPRQRLLLVPTVPEQCSEQNLRFQDHLNLSTELTLNWQ